MRLPVKINEECLPKALVKILRGQPDPRLLLKPDLESSHFTRAVSVLKFGSTFKTTKQNRFPQTIDLLTRLMASKSLTILDLGASDGSTSLDLLQHLNYLAYYITDLNPEISIRVCGKWTYFFDPAGNPLLAVSDKILIYKDSEGAIKPISYFVDQYYQKIEKLFFEEMQDIKLINPALKPYLGDNVIFQRYNAFEAWPGEKVDLVVAANLLNRSYFDNQELRAIMLNIIQALKKPGWVALIDNRKEEQSSIVRLNKPEIEVEARVGKGAEVEELFLEIAIKPH